MKDAFKDADSFDLTVDKITIEGDSATVKVTSGRGSNKKSDTLALKRERHDLEGRLARELTPHSARPSQRGSSPSTTMNGLLSVESTVLPASSVTWTRYV